MAQVRPDSGAARAFLDANPTARSIDLLIADGNGIVRGKRIDAGQLVKVFADGICLPRSVFALDSCGHTVEATGLGFETGDADSVCRPVADTLSLTGWRSGADAQLLLAMEGEDGAPFFADPRVVLARVLQRFADLGLTPVLALELEFYLLDRQPDEDGRPQPPRSPVTGQRETATQVYGINELDDYAGLIDEVNRLAHIQDVPASTAVSEYAPGQYEVNLSHLPDAVRAADHAVLLKRIVRRAAAGLDLDATFMAKPYAAQSGSGTHVHVSLLDQTGANVFTGSDPRGSETLRWAVGGLAATMGESMALLAPNGNSFRRFQPDNFVPLAPSWGFNNRTVALRIPAGDDKATRIEHRVAGADANPYLVTAAVLAGIHYGIVRRIGPPPVTEGDASLQHGRELPLSWLHAIEAFDASAVMADYLGADFMRIYSAVRRYEHDQFAAVITPTEYDWYLRVV